jgi:hypothetical protein
MAADRVPARGRAHDLAGASLCSVSGPPQTGGAPPPVPEPGPEPGRAAARRDPPPPLEANDELVALVMTACWAVALVVLLIVRGDIAPPERWWVWTAVAGLGQGLFALWYVPRLKRGRTRLAARRAEERAGPQP